MYAQILPQWTPPKPPIHVRLISPALVNAGQHGNLHAHLAAGVVRELPLPVKDQPYEPAWWDIDTAAGTATLRSPETRLGSLRLPLDPMLGCFGVAPEDEQSISTATSGTHGGNMDYRGFRAGVTVYLPVFVPGGLLFMGDGHAVQSDGEICGTGALSCSSGQSAPNVVNCPASNTACSARAICHPPDPSAFYPVRTSV